MGEGPPAALLQQIFEVDPLACPTCRGPMQILAFITLTSVIDQILTQLRTRASRALHAGPRSPHRRGPPRAGARHAPHTRPPTLRPSPEDGPDAPPPHGDLRYGRPSHPRDGWVPAGIAPPTMTAVPTVLNAREPLGGHANARRTVLARSAIAL